MLTVSGLCMCDKCVEHTTDIYRMVGSCINCGGNPILGMFRSGDKARPLDCPVCGNWRCVRWYRLAREGEFPEAVVPQEG